MSFNKFSTSQPAANTAKPGNKSTPTPSKTKPGVQPTSKPAGAAPAPKSKS